MKSRKEYIERKLRRMQGMSAEANARMLEANASQLWRARCPHCGHWNVADRAQLLKINCIGCDKPIGKRV